MDEWPCRDNHQQLQNTEILIRTPEYQMIEASPCYLCNENSLESSLGASLSRALSRRYDLSIKLFYQHRGNRAIYNPQLMARLTRLIDQHTTSRVLGAVYSRGESKLLLKDISMLSRRSLPKAKDCKLQAKLDQMNSRLRDKYEFNKVKKVKNYRNAKQDDFHKTDFTEIFVANQDTTSGPKDIALSYIRPMNDSTVESSTFNILDELSELLMSGKQKLSLKMTEGMITDTNTVMPNFFLKSKPTSIINKALLQSKSRITHIASPISPKSPQKDLFKEKRTIFDVPGSEKSTPAKKLRMNQLKNSLQAAAQINTPSSKTSQDIKPASLLRMTKTQGCYSPDMLKVRQGLPSETCSAMTSARPGDIINKDMIKGSTIQILEKYSIRATSKKTSLRESKSNRVYMTLNHSSWNKIDKKDKFNGKQSLIEPSEKPGYLMDSPHSRKITLKPRVIGLSSISISSQKTKGRSNEGSVIQELGNVSPKTSIRSCRISQDSSRIIKPYKTVIDMDKLAEMKNKLKLISERRKNKVFEKVEKKATPLKRRIPEDSPTDPTNIYARPASLWDKKTLEQRVKTCTKPGKTSPQPQKNPEKLGVAVSSFWQKVAATKQRLSKK